MEKLSDTAIEELVQKKLGGESYSRIRASLSAMGFKNEEIKSIIRKVDERVLRAEIDQGNRYRAKSWHQIGLALAALGLLLTIGTNVGWILNDTSKWIIYSPFFAGILIMLYGRLLQHKKVDPFEKGPGSIRKKRPYK